MSLLEQDTTRKKQMNKLFPELEPKFDASNNKEYKIKAIKDSAIYAKEAEGHLSSLDYLVSWKSYPKEESIWKLSSTIIQLRKIISTFYKDYPEKPTAISPLLNSALLIAKPLVKPIKFIKPSAKQKQGCPISSMKQVKE